MVPTRDGTALHTVVYEPRERGRRPVVLTRGYWPGLAADAQRFCDAGYAYVGQSTRGHGRSEGAGGIRRRFFHDAADGQDALTWLAAQEFCDGRVAMYGKSYWAITQWLVAVAGHPNLSAIIPQCSATDVWKHGYWKNGALQLAMTARGRAYDKPQWAAIEAMGWDRFFRYLPLRTLDDVFGSANPERMEAENRGLWRDYLEHQTFDDYWQELCIRGDNADGRLARITVPVLQMGGWYDAYAGAALEVAETLRRLGRVPESKVVIDPSDHINRIVGDRDFGPAASKDEIAIATGWLDRVFGRVERAPEADVRMFTMGVNRWREDDAWPPVGEALTLCLDADGRLRAGAAGGGASAYRYDPDDPVPTLGGNHSFSDQNIPHVIRPGPVDQAPLADRADVLAFATQPLTGDLEVTGPVRVKLFASSSAPDTDFVARLLDIRPDGVAFNLAEGIVRARYRHSIYAAPQLLTPGEVFGYEIELAPTSNVFRRGHRIGLHVTSSGFPLWDRNPNTGGRQGEDTTVVVADQTVYHDRDRPSSIRLHVPGADASHVIRTAFASQPTP